MRCGDLRKKPGPAIRAGYSFSAGDNQAKSGRVFLPISCYMTTTTAPPPSLLDELDLRQNEVLKQLDELNQQLELILAESAPAPPQ